MAQKKKSKQGFAALSPEQRQEIARLGGLAVAKENRSFSQDRALAADAGRKGGLKRAGTSLTEARAARMQRLLARLPEPDAE